MTVESPAGPSTPKDVVSNDRLWNVGLAYRYFFSFDSSAKTPAVGYAGVRFGVESQVFEIDAKAQVITAWAELADTARDLRAPWLSSRTPRRTAEWVASSGVDGDAAAAVRL